MKRYYLGPFTRQPLGNSVAYAPPVGVVGCIDLAPVPVQAVMSEFRPVGLFVTTAAVLPSEYTLIAEGDCREIKATTRMQDAVASAVGYRPQGETLVDLIYDALTDGSDPKGDSAPKPLMPGMNGWCDLHLGGHSRILSAKFEWGKPCSRGRGHWQKIKQVLRDEFDELFKAAKAGKLKDAEHHRRVLDFNCDKFGLKGNDWKELVPTKLQKDVPGRLQHETTITDNFTRADGDTIGNSLTWSEVVNDWDTVSNAVNLTTTDAYGFVRAESDLSSSDHYSQWSMTMGGSGTNQQFGPMVRFASAATTGYLMLARPSDGLYRTYKIVTGSFTQLTSNTLTIDTNTYKTQASGSTISVFKAGANQQDVTDTAISGNTRCGSMGFRPSGESSPVWDDFEAADLGGGGGGGLLYTQLERSTRGVNRGTYTGW